MSQDLSQEMGEEIAAMTAEDLDIGRLHSSLGFLARIAQLKIFEHFYAEFAESGLKPGEFSVLSIIERNPGVRQGVLAQRLMIKRAHMTKLIRGFEERGFVSRRIPDSDRRAVELTLTRKGCAFVKRHSAAFSSYMKSRPSALTDAEEEQLIYLLQKFNGLTPGGAS